MIQESFGVYPSQVYWIYHVIRYQIYS